MYNMNIKICLSWILLSVLTSSCGLQELRTQTEDLKKEEEELNQLLVTQRKQFQAQIEALNFLADSLHQEMVEAKGLLPDSLVVQNDSLKRLVDQLNLQLIQSELKEEELLVKLKQTQTQFKNKYRLPNNRVVQVRTGLGTYDCYIVDLKQSNLKFYWKDKQGKPLKSLKALASHTSEDNCEELIFGTNAGMYLNDQSPQGLFIQDGKELRPIDRRKEEFGNFYMQPNGVFYIDSNQVAKVVTTDEFGENAFAMAQYATQSGPMVLRDGRINSKFGQKSTNKYIRSGVGIINKHKVVFVISNQPVNFYDFATVFKDKFKCSNALYLDGAISQMYLPELGRFQEGGQFGPMIGITKR